MSGAQRVRYGIVLAVLGVLAAASVAAHAAGYGFGGHRLLLYEPGELYVLNLTDEPRRIGVDGNSTHDVAAGGARLLPVLGGPVTVEVGTQAGSPWQSWEIEVDGAPLFVNLSDEACVVVSRVLGLEDESPVEVQIEDQLPPGPELHELAPGSVIWPRAYPEAIEHSGAEPVWSVEVVDCSLVGEESFLADYVATRIEGRRS